MLAPTRSGRVGLPAILVNETRCSGKGKNEVEGEGMKPVAVVGGRTRVITNGWHVRTGCTSFTPLSIFASFLLRILCILACYGGEGIWSRVDYVSDRLCSR